MQVEDIHSKIREARSTWIQGDADAFALLFRDDGEFVVPGQRHVGPAAIQRVAAQFSEAFTDVQIQIQQIIVEQNRAVVEWLWEDTERATGRRSVAADAIVIEFDDTGLIYRWREYIDSHSCLCREERA